MRAASYLDDGAGIRIAELSEKSGESALPQIGIVFVIKLRFEEREHPTTMPQRRSAVRSTQRERPLRRRKGLLECASADYSTVTFSV